jgi:two-component system response regulator HupR/HoxA
MLALGEEGKQLGAELLSSRVLLAAKADDVAELNFLSKFEGKLKDRLDALEACIIKETILRHRWNRSRAAEELGLSRVGLRSKLSRYGLDKGLEDK